MSFRDHQAIAHEDHGRLQCLRQIGTRAQRGIRAERQRLDLAILDEREAALILDELARFELHRLQVAGVAGWLEAELLELAAHIGDGLPEALAADVAALQFVVGQKLHMGPPEFAFGGIVDDARKQRQGDPEEKKLLGKGHYPYRSITNPRSRRAAKVSGTRSEERRVGKEG